MNDLNSTVDVDIENFIGARNCLPYFGFCQLSEG